MESKKTQEPCSHCRKPFTPKQWFQKYCTPNCRLRAFRHRKKWLEQKLKSPEGQKEEG